MSKLGFSAMYRVSGYISFNGFLHDDRITQEDTIDSGRFISGKFIEFMEQQCYRSGALDGATLPRRQYTCIKHAFRLFKEKL